MHLPAWRTPSVLVAAAVAVIVAVAAIVAVVSSETPLTAADAATGANDAATATAAPTPTTDEGPAASTVPPTAPEETAAEVTAADEPEAAQLRGIWVHLFDETLKSPGGIDQLLDTAVASNLNTVVVQAARRHDAFYASGVLPASTDDELPGGFDMLGELIPAAHDRGLQVHVWYSIVPSMHATMVDEALGADHLHSRHGFGSDDPWLQAGNDPDYAYMDPAIPGFQDHVVAMLRDVVERHDVDGVHLDYTRYECLQVAADGSCAPAGPGADATANQHPVTMQRYAAHGDGSLGDFMRAQTQDLVRRVYLEIADLDPSVLVSAAVIAQGEGPGADRGAFTGSRAYWNKGQDWASWVDEGIVDHVYPMAYFRETDARWAQAYDDWVAFTGAIDNDETVVAVGQGSYLNCVGDSLSQLTEAVGATDGVVLYSYQGDVAEASQCPDATSGDLLKQLRDGLFAEPARVPEVPRKAAPTDGHILVAAADGQTVTVTTEGAEPVSRRADATGHAGFVWLDPGEWQVSVDGGAPQTVTVTAGDVTRVESR